MQQLFGNRAVQRMLKAPAARDRWEDDADRSASRVMRGAPQPQAPASAATGGLPAGVREFMEPRLGADFGDVRVHTGPDAARMNELLHARAFTAGRDIYYGANARPANDAVTAHELTHVVQQSRDGAAPGIQRAIQLQDPPGRRAVASALDRGIEIVERLNDLSPGVLYTLEDNHIRYTRLDESLETEFDRQMEDFIDRPEVVPLRLVTRRRRIRAGRRLLPIVVDDFSFGMVDLDDLAATDDASFQMILVHFLSERFSVPNYENRVGTPPLDQRTPAGRTRFQRAHRAAMRAEAGFLQDWFDDPSIRFNYQEQKADRQTVIQAFFSVDERYTIFMVIRGVRRESTSADSFVRTADGRRLSVDDFLDERAAAGP